MTGGERVLRDGPPRVSVGMPVFNGEAFLADAIESILAQTFDDLELIISDNASTDRTQEICEHYAERDPRIRYVRQPKNLGASPNYNYTFHEARGEYFKWAAYDDVVRPTFIERCVEVLDRYPDVQLAFTRTLRINPQGVIMGTYPDYGDMRLMSSRPSRRFGDMVCMQHNTVGCFFGLMRRRELETSVLHASHEGADRHLLAELALRGLLFEIPEQLFERREHPASYSDSASIADRIGWWDTSRAGEITFPQWNTLRIYRGLIRKTSMSDRERLACRLQLIRWFIGPKWYRQRWLILVRDALRGGLKYRSQAQQVR
jgi:glycosyltransferase involved in cell wall biosynthesis